MGTRITIDKTLGFWGWAFIVSVVICLLSQCS